MPDVKRRVLTATAAMLLGKRPQQEDRFVISEVTHGKYQGTVLAVMDGHSGSDQIPVYCKRQLTKTLLSCAKKAGSEEEMLRMAVTRLHLKTQKLRGGSTISICFVNEKTGRVTIAILGDSPVITMNANGEIRRSLAHNARTNIEDRLAAIKSGARYFDGYIEIPNGHGLQLTRSLGDMDFDKVLSREPEVYTVENTEIVVVASDGLIGPEHDDQSEKYMKIIETIRGAKNAKEITDWVQFFLVPRDNTTVILWKRPQ